MKLKINPELRDLLPPLSPTQFEKLKAEIIRDGCITPLTLWNDVIVDGHNRYEICSKHDIRFQTVQKEFPSLDEAKLWMWANQDGRRSLTRFGRVEFALKIKDVIATQSKKRQRAAGGDRKSHKKKSLPQNSAEAIRVKETRQQIAEFAGVSHDTVDRVEYILAHADKDTINALRWDAKGISINKVFTDIKAVVEAQKPTKPKKNRATKATTNSAGTASTSSKTTETKAPEAKATTTKPQPQSEAKPETELPFKTGLYCRPGEKPGATGEPYVTSSSLTDLPHNQPEVLVAQLIAHFPREYARKCPFLILDALRANDGSETTIPLARDIIEEFGDR